MVNWKEPKIYAVKHKDKDVRAASRSGGIFTALSDAVFLEKGVVYGCVLTEKFEAVHIRTEKIKDRNRMSGSKYIQSNMGDVFKFAADDLNDGRKVLFSGTSCQVAGLRAFLGKEYSNLICVDIVCHGVPSTLVWNQYLNWQESRHGKIVSVEFRNKKDFGWLNHVETLVTERSGIINSKVFATLFYGHSILRPSCYVCPYKNIIHPGDITIADYWGIDRAAPGFNDNKGVSLVLINNDVGEITFESVKESIDWCATRIEDSMQPPLKGPFEEPKERTRFWNSFYEDSFEAVARKYGGLGWRYRFKQLMRRIKCLIKVANKG